MSVDGSGSYNATDDLEAIENDTLPGTSNVKKIIGSLKLRLAQDNPTNTDTNINRTERVDVSTPPKAQGVLDQLGLGEGFNTPVEYKVPTSLASTTTPAVADPAAPSMTNPTEPASVAMPGATTMDDTGGMPGVMGSFNAIAYVIENGEIKCASCENYYIPESEAHIKSAHCGAPECPDLRTEEDMKGVDGVMVASKLPEDAEEGDVVRGKMIKTTDEETRLASTDDYLAAFEKTSSDSTMYYRGYEDAKAGRPLDEDLAELSDDYFHGYDQFKHYHEDPQKSAPQSLYDIKPNSNNNPRERLTQGEVDRGPLELTDGTNHATASKVLGLYEGFKTAEYTGTDVSRMSKEQRETGSVCKSPSGLSQAHIDTYGGSATCGKPATGRTDNGAPTCGGSNCGTKVKPLGTISSKISSIHASNDSLKEASPLDFAHALEQSGQAKREQKREIAMNMALQAPFLNQMEENNCKLCETLGHTNSHAMHESFVPQQEAPKPTFNSGEPAPQGPKVNPIRPVRQQIGELLDVGKNIGTEVAKEQAEMAPKELATEIAGGGPEDPLADIAAGGEEAWAIGKGVAKGLIKSPLKTVQVGKDIKQDAQAVVPKVKKLLSVSSKSVFPTDVIGKFFED